MGDRKTNGRVVDSLLFPGCVGILSTTAGWGAEGFVRKGSMIAKDGDEEWHEGI